MTFPREDIAQHIELVLIGPGLIYGLVHKLDCIRKRFTIDVDKLIFMMGLLKPKQAAQVRRNAAKLRVHYAAEYTTILKKAFEIYDNDEDTLRAQEQINDDQTYARVNPLSRNDPRAAAGITPGVEHSLMHGQDGDVVVDAQTLERLSDRLRRDTGPRCPGRAPVPCETVPRCTS